ncbi:LOW QUALITY PROTEIN: hypothetical protein ACHAXS_000329, partial [Conticribra weissflogii]
QVWNHYLVDKLIDARYVQTSIDDCVFYKGSIIFIVYVNNGIFLGGTDNQLIKEIKLLQSMNSDIEYQDHLSDYVDGSYKAFLQEKAHINVVKPPHFMIAIISSSNIVGKLNYLSQTSIPDIIFAIHQLARYSAEPREDHGKAVEWLKMCLNHTKTIQVIFKHDLIDMPTQILQEYFNENSPNKIQPVPNHVHNVWVSKLKTLITLRTTEAEYIALSSALHDIIPIIQLIDKMEKKGFQVLCT